MSTPDRMLSILDLFRDDTTAAFQEDVMEHLECSRARLPLPEVADRKRTAGADLGRRLLGSRIIELDRHLRQHDPLMRAARDVMRAAGDELHANLMLCSYWRQGHVRGPLLDRRLHRIELRARPAFPMFRGATAKPILANLPPYQLRNLMLWHAAEIREAGLGEDWDEFRANLKQLRAAGVCVSHGEVDRGLMGIGAAIFSPDQKVVGSLVFIASQARTTAQRLEALKTRIQAAAAQVSENLLAPQSNGAAAIGIMPSRPRRMRTRTGATPARTKP